MKIKSISFGNYKAFAEIQTLNIRPITFLIGKNSSGKSSIAKLFTLLEKSLTKEIDEPLLLKNDGVELGGEFRDLVFGRQPNDPIYLSVHFENEVEIKASIVQLNDLDLKIINWIYKDSESDFAIEFSPDKGYVDAKGNVFECLFKGILPIKILDIDKQNSTNRLNLDLSIDVDYIGPFRVLPERQFYLIGQTKFRDTGITGENAYAMLGVSKLADTDLHKKVGKWYSKNFNGWELKVEDKNRPFIQIVLSKDNIDVNIVDVGQGMNQALPLVVRANVTDRPDSMIVMEQPELHLHPAAHGDMAELFARSAKENNQTFIIETHSENMILRIRKLVTENNFGFTKDDVIIYWIEESHITGQELKEITIDGEGVLSDWPEGVFNENIREILEMEKIVYMKNNKP